MGNAVCYCSTWREMRLQRGGWQGDSEGQGTRVRSVFWKPGEVGVWCYERVFTGGDAEVTRGERGLSGGSLGGGGRHARGGWRDWGGSREMLDQVVGDRWGGDRMWGKGE